jgi:hypothetical protein
VQQRELFLDRVKSYQWRMICAILALVFVFFGAIACYVALAIGSLAAIISIDHVLATIVIPSLTVIIGLAAIIGLGFLGYRLLQPIWDARQLLRCPICEYSLIQFSHWTHQFHCCPRCGFDPFSGQQRIVVRVHKPFVFPQSMKRRLFIGIYFGTYPGICVSLAFLMVNMELKSNQLPQITDFLSIGMGLVFWLAGWFWIIRVFELRKPPSPHLECALCRMPFTFPDAVQSNACRKCRAILVNAFPTEFQTNSDVECS